MQVTGAPALRAARIHWVVCILAAIVALLAVPSFAQLSTASVNGVVRDPKGAVVPGATVVLHNVDTSVDHTSVTNGSGEYVLLNITPGKYTLQASAKGFDPQQISQFVLAVDQIATFDFALAIGSDTKVVTVEALAPQLDVTSANLGTVIETKQVNDLPLDGRNFTALLALTPGVVPIMTGQNAGMNGGGGFGAPVAIGADYAFPSINGQTNRSDYFLMDGLNNYGTLESTYAVPPIIDAIQEFKVVSHTDNAEYGDVLGGVVNVVTKSGTNELHGSAWEYIRNNVFDARNYFLPQGTSNAFHQNQFGAAGGGPVVFPKLYNGKNKTFFFGAYQGWRYSRPSNNNLLVPTDAELAGNEADNGQLPIYNPYETVPSGNFFTRPAFTNNQIPSNLIDPRMVAYAQFIFPKAGSFFSPNGHGGFLYNAVDTTPLVQDQNELNGRIDQTFGPKDSGWFRLSAINEKVTSSGGLPGLPSTLIIHARDWGGSYVHIISPTKIIQGQFAKTSVLDNSTTRFAASTSSIYSTVGFADSFANGFAGAGGGFLIPGPGINNLSNGGESIDDTPQATNSFEYKGTYTQILGNHEIKFGGGYIATGFLSPLSQIGLSFGTQPTDDPNPNDTASTGDGLSSFLLNVPTGGSRRNVYETERPGGLLAFFLQDSWKAMRHLTLNYGLRYDYPFIPAYGTNATIGEQGGIETGDIDFSNGTYILQKEPPLCSVRGHAPCIPDATVADPAIWSHVVVAPFGHISHNVHSNFGPRFGFAWQADEKTVVHGAFGIVFDDWAAVTQMAQNIEGSWPDIGQQIAPVSTNVPTSGNPTPTVTAQNPFGSGASSLFPPTSPFTSNQWFYDPHIKNPYSEQWNFGIQRQLNPSLVLRVDYVGSGSHRTNVGGLYNTALTPGPGDTQPRALYPYSIPTFYDRSIGTASYNALQVQLDKRYANGFSYQVAYTWSKSLAEDDGWFGVEGETVQNPYDPQASYGLSGTNLPHVFSANGLYDIPVGPGKRLSTGNKIGDYILGNWQLNDIFTFRNGQNFTASDSANNGDQANIGGGSQRANQVGDPHLDHRTTSEWFNINAFAIPARYTFGDAGRNSLQAQRWINMDMSVIRSFPFWGEGRRFEFRAEAFNIFNHPVFGIPNGDVNSSGFGSISNTANGPRQMQFSGKIVF
ncbi:carboxypeptidase regulatory-like domain-containing protein [Acidicapsa dinghuensis]|uniref:Carboxypeptidase regulatory-like domain-containing protein n=1 Tax=Acidicapsa dinghuensis TaxID=2218256 RepID=A0ABW1ECQ9_9BACT|nr:carboxypeptidase regulatory-like domain-containing protein [Acidicapsa dinghuensis]